MDSHDLHRLRFLLAALKETDIQPDTERRLLAEFERLWPPRKTEHGAEPGEELIGSCRGRQRA